MSNSNTEYLGVSRRIGAFFKHAIRSLEALRLRRLNNLKKQIRSIHREFAAAPSMNIRRGLKASFLRTNYVLLTDYSLIAFIVTIIAICGTSVHLLGMDVGIVQQVISCLISYLFGWVIVVCVCILGGSLYPNPCRYMCVPLIVALVTTMVLVIVFETRMSDIDVAPTRFQFLRHSLIAIAIGYVLIIWAAIVESGWMSAEAAGVRTLQIDQTTSIRFSHILIVQAQDHYVEITTSKGKHFLRKSFKETVKMLESERGHVVHRSYWVRERAIKQLDKEGRKHVLTTVFGERIPVTRHPEF